MPKCYLLLVYGGLVGGVLVVEIDPPEDIDFKPWVDGISIVDKVHTIARGFRRLTVMKYS